jgi:hypothetical protein
MVLEHGEARFLIGCWCPGKPGSRDMDDERQMRSYVLTASALDEAWKHHQAGDLQVIKLGDAVSAGRIR